MQLVGHQEQLHTEALMGTKKKEGQEVAETVQLVSHQEQLHTETLIGVKKNQEQLNLAVKEDKVQRMTQKMMTHQLHQAQEQAEIPENVGIKRNLTKEREATIMNQSTTTKRKRKNKQ